MLRSNLLSAKVSFSAGMFATSICTPGGLDFGLAKHAEHAASMDGSMSVAWMLRGAARWVRDRMAAVA
jgi:hypothetical protein